MALIRDSKLNATSFCIGCREFLWRPQDPFAEYSDHWIPEVEELMASVKDNCCICRTFWLTAAKQSMDWIFNPRFNDFTILRRLRRDKNSVYIEFAREEFQLRPLLSIFDPLIAE
jgi:hypothetical protein